MRTYTGKRTRAGVEVLVNGRTLPLRLELCNHSPTGFEWGYGGSGPAQLALAIMASHFESDTAAVVKNSPKAIHERAFKHYQRFKFDVIAGLPFEGWTLTTEDIDKWLAGQGGV